MRKLYDYEAMLIADLLVGIPEGVRFLNEISNYCVVEENDGGMGSLRFVSNSRKDTKFGRELCEKRYLDDDGAVISAAINLDEVGNLFELDIWRTDFFPVIRHPGKTVKA